MRLFIYLFIAFGYVLPTFGQEKNEASFIAPLHFTKMKVSSETYESVGVFDVNGDGHPDLISGAFWYQGPKFIERHLITEVKRVGEYWDDFLTIPLDVNGDGKMDVITGGWFGATLYWLENPGTNGTWKQHIIDETGNIETAHGWDIDGDGIMEIFPNNPGKPLKYYKLNKDAEGKGTGLFTKFEVAETQGHGLGFGDVNGDSRSDIIVNNGWLEAPSDSKGKWSLHQEFDFGDASVPILVVDVNNDDLNDLIVGQAHSYGLDWYEQKVDQEGKRSWIKHPIDPYNSQFHTMQWMDIDGDGKPELITGKRYRAHNGKDPGANDPFGLYYFKWNGESFTKNIISYGSVDQGKGAGIYFSIADLRGSGRNDIVVAGKDGLYIFFNEGSAL
ncbi:FG-GAP repeat domain-containing protein [Albibacterium bauzanense]|uniref:FG-GAP repeat protein n=1 Tax=Albibacterium bauzanense TaxID=653929 RepID=A0A4R1LUW2_9SPHI|nr:VCBS repeat-containing protein [Albibacterium bauzanense]TCK83148.1 FG-GAP repeat protein [Albibacterium bauzanense]